MKLLKKTCLALACSTLLLSACGGGGIEPIVDPAPEMLVGTAAAGAGLTGTVTVKDADGVTRTSSISNGAYVINVAGLRAPFVLRADGTAGGRHYEIHSVATAADVNGTVNITPLTDLIVANIAGQLAASFFEAPTFSALTAEAISAQETALQARLQSVLTAVGVDVAIDLLHSAFLPDHSGLDAALDALRVTVDESTQIAIITNVITQETIEDNLTSSADNTPLPLQNPGEMLEGLTDLQAILQAMNTFAAQFADGLPQEAALLPLIADSFLDDDKNKSDFIAEISGSPDMIGFQIGNIQLLALNGEVAVIGFDMIDSAGVVRDRVQGFSLLRVGNGWLLRGNQRLVSVYGRPKSLLSFNNSDAPHTSTGLEFYIRDDDDSNSPGVNRAVISGPGLPDGGVTYLKSDMGGGWQTSYTPVGQQHQVSSQFYPLADGAISGMPLQSAFNVQLYAGEQLFATYPLYMNQRPYTMAQLQNVAFPLLGAPTLQQFSSYVGGTLQIAGTAPASVASVRLGLGLDGDHADLDVNTSNGSFSTQALTIPLKDAVSWRNLNVSYREPGDREVMTEYQQNTPQP